MPIRVSQFGGVRPRTNAEKLADFEAQTAQNCDLTAGVLAPISVRAPFTSLVNADGTLKGEIPVADLITITKPDKPTIYQSVTQIPGDGVIIDTGVYHICRPRHWLTVRARTWFSWVEDAFDVDGNPTQENWQEYWEEELTPLSGSIEYNEGGLVFSVELSPFWFDMVRKRGGPTTVRGPLFQFHFTPNSSLGGPDEEFWLPMGFTHKDPIIPEGIVPLVHRNNIYAAWQCVDYAGPIYDEDVKLDYVEERRHYYPATGQSAVATFNIKMNYTDPRRKHFFYMGTAVTNADEEGPPSEISAEFVLKPGEEMTIYCPRPVGYGKNKLYRSTTGGDDFMLLEDVNGDTYREHGDATTSTPLPPYGNYPSGANVNEFIAGSVIHPAQFAAAFWEDHLYLSDYYRFWVWPEEYAIPFEADIAAIALTGNTILVFVNDKVYGVSGGNPAQMAKYLISETARLLSVKTLARIGQTVLWVTDDGLAACNGGEVVNLTKNHYTRNEWMALAPDERTASVADNSYFLVK